MQYILYVYSFYDTHVECKILNKVGLYLVPGQYVILYSWCISRPYTPIIWTCESLVLLVKIYKQGEFSTHLKNAPIGSEIDIRGPYGDFKYECNRCVKIYTRKIALTTQCL